MSKEVTLFDARCRIPDLTRPAGAPVGEPQARLKFPDTQTAADFINHGLAESDYTAYPVTLEYLNATHEAPTGPNNEYDAFVSRPDKETGDVSMFIRRYGNHELPAHAALSSFVVETAQRMADAEQA